MERVASSAILLNFFWFCFFFLKERNYCLHAQPHTCTSVFFPRKFELHVYQLVHAGVGKSHWGRKNTERFTSACDYCRDVGRAGRQKALQHSASNRTHQVKASSRIYGTVFADKLCMDPQDFQNCINSTQTCNRCTALVFGRDLLLLPVQQSQ